MAIDFEGDLAEVFSTDDHAVEVTHQGRRFTGILNKEFFAHDVGEVGIDGSEPAFYCQSSLADPIRQGDELTVDGTLYKVSTDPEPDGAGMSRIALNNG